jgi:hypothetical protein
MKSPQLYAGVEAQRQRLEVAAAESLEEGRSD